MNAASNQAICFADICGSTSLFESLGNRDALQLVSGVLDFLGLVVREHDGRVVKYAGDAVLAVFDQASRAMSAARRMHRRLRARPVLKGLPAVTIHVGLHWGEVILTPNDVHGDAVNVAARLAALAKPGQILTTRETLEDLDISRRGGARRVTRLAVRGRRRELEVFEVLWDANGLTLISPAIPDSESLEPSRLALVRGRRRVMVGPSRPLVSLGRGEYNHIILKSAWVSRSHAKVELRRNRFMLVDWSSNGTYVYRPGEPQVFIKQNEYALEGEGVMVLGRPGEAGSPEAVAYKVLKPGQAG